MITYAEFGYLCGTLILPLAMVLHVILHFRNDKYLHLYTLFMMLAFFTTPAWFVVASGLFLMAIDVINKWVKKRKEECDFVKLD